MTPALRKIIAELEALAESTDTHASEDIVDLSSSAKTAMAIRRAERTMEFRRYRNSRFADLAPLLAEPAWDMVMHLFLANMEGRELSVTELESLCGIPHSTAFRLKRMLIDAGWIEQRPAKRDARKEMLSLTRRRMSEMVDFLLSAPS